MLDPNRIDQMRNALNSIESSFDLSQEIKNDPISLVLTFRKKEDQEVAALITAVFSYGNVKQIQNILEKIFLITGPSPARKLRETSSRRWKTLIPKNFKHRFNTAEDLGILFSWIGEVLRKYRSLEDFFWDQPHDGDIRGKLENFADRMTRLPADGYKIPKSKGPRFFFPKPSGKSACKRLLLFLRWVAGTGPMDLGIWKDFPRDQLVIPVDTHVLRISRHLGFTKRIDSSWVSAVEITNALKNLDPDDPTRFDFALCHLGISKECPSRFDLKICRRCRMNNLCLTYAKSAH